MKACIIGGLGDNIANGLFIGRFGTLSFDLAKPISVAPFSRSLPDGRTHEGEVGNDLGEANSVTIFRKEIRLGRVKFSVAPKMIFTRGADGLDIVEQLLLL